MIIKKFILNGLYHRDDLNFSFDLNKDINILTGKNGSGKTTILKIIWYLISGNIEKIISDIEFDELKIETNEFSLSIKLYNQKIKKHSKKSKKRKIKYLKRRGNTEEDRIEIIYNFGSNEQKKDMSLEKFHENEMIPFLNTNIIELSKNSIFFPTFRRIEGNFIANNSERREQTSSFDEIMRMMEGRRVYGEIDKAFYYLSNFLSVQKHRFITSISADDISNLLTRHYADISEKTNSLYKALSEFIVTKTLLTQKQDIENKSKNFENILLEIQNDVNTKNSEIDSLMNPFHVLEHHIKDIFQYKGIKITDSLILGNPDNVISSDDLSAGEKQLLSFLCYNAFHVDTIIFIDEPELSLHVDWQRLLIDILVEQNTTNQFIISTHSPFIYSQYPDKEIIIDEDKGYTQAPNLS